MTPLEKASQMIVDYQLTFKSLSYEEAVQCSIRTIDDILQELELVCVDEMVQFSNRWKYWEEVKELLQKQSNKHHIVKTTEMIDHIVDTNEMVSSQTEISDEEIEKAAHNYAEVYQCPIEIKMCKHDIISAWNKAIKWYRERLKKKQ